MKKLSTLAIAAALVGTISVSALAPSLATASNHGDGQRAEQSQMGQKDGQHQRMARGGHGFLGMVCAPQAADRAGKQLDKMAERLKLNDDQQTAFATFKSAVANAQTEAADACAPLQVKAPSTPVDDMEKRSAMLQLQLDALSQVTPAFADFYDTLDDAQKSELAKMGPKGGKRGGMMHKGDGPRHAPDAQKAPQGSGNGDGA